MIVGELCILIHIFGHPTNTFLLIVEPVIICTRFEATGNNADRIWGVFAWGL